MCLHMVLHLSFAQAERMALSGAMTADEWEAYRALWLYGAPRFSDIAGPKLSISRLHAALDAGQDFITYDAGTPDEQRIYFR